MDKNELGDSDKNLMDLQPKVSIGLLVYNGGKYLSKALDSLLAQTFEDFELIISDNASTDNTQSICQEYVRTNDKIRYFRQIENIGPILNYKYVLEKARGEYFMWASHDDLWDPNFIKECLKVFSTNQNCVSVFSHFNVFDLKVNEIKQKITPTSCSSSSQFIRFSTRLFEMHPNMIFGLHKTEIIRKVKFDTFDWFDIFITIQLAFHGQILIIPWELYTAGIDGLRKPYSITGEYISLIDFKKNLFFFIKRRFSFPKRIFLILYVSYISFINERMFYKVIKNWRN